MSRCFVRVARFSTVSSNGSVVSIGGIDPRNSEPKFKAIIAKVKKNNGRIDDYGVGKAVTLVYEAGCLAWEKSLPWQK